MIMSTALVDSYALLWIVCVILFASGSDRLWDLGTISGAGGLSLCLVKVAVYSTKSYDERSLSAANADHGHELVFLEARLMPYTVALAAGCDAVCVFVNDVLDREVLELLVANDVRLVALRSAGFNHVDMREVCFWVGWPSDCPLAS
jgi:hypothetical protein